MTLRFARSLISFTLVLSFVLPATLRAQDRVGALSGTVTDATTNAPLAGADVVVEGTSFTTATDRAGNFRLAALPPGPHTLIVVYLGHADQRASVTVAAGETTRVDVKLAKTTFSETVQVLAPIGEGQAQALNQQRTAANIVNIVSADQIGSFPDPNAAEATQRIPGVSIARDQGEGRYVLVRGTEARLNSMMIDGERIPAPEGDVRQVALDAVPADQLQSIEVAKAVTPDMDADSIGGAVNLVTKQAVTKPTALFSIAGGYNGLQQDAGQSIFTGTLGRRFAGGRAGLLVGASGSNLTRGSENFEATYAAGALADLQLRDYQINRERYGFNASGDVAVNPNATLQFKSIFNEFKDYEVNNRIRFRPSNSRIEHVLKNRNQNQHIRSVSAGSQNVLAARTTIDAKLAWAQAQEHQPDRLDTIFRQSRISFAPNVSLASIDPTNIQPNPSANNAANATLNAWETEVFKTTDRDITGSFNLRTPLRSDSSFASFLKIGAKVKDKRKERDFEAGAASPPSTVPFSQLQDSTFDNDSFLSFFPANYAPFPGIAAGNSRALFNSVGRARLAVDREGDAENYQAKERVSAAYAMAEFYVGEKLMLLPGVRYERTNVNYTGYNVLYDADGNYRSTQTLTGKDSYGQFLPGLHLKYSLSQDSNLRVAYTRTLARPNYVDLVPYQIVFQEDGEIARGNSSLRATTSNNVDVLLERYFRSVGVVSGGLFYKRLADYIYPFRFLETNFGELYEVTQPRNGDAASLWGLEFALQNQLRFLPKPFDGLGIYANYTYTDSSAQFPDRSQTSTLPGQSAHIGNFSLFYEKAGFSAKTNWNFHGKYVDAVGGTAAQDVYYDTHTQWDVNIGQRLTRNLRLYADFLNLTNAPLRYYEGTSNRPIQEEYYRWWSTFGLKVNF